MTEAEKIKFVLIQLIDALERKGTVRDGNGGFPSFAEELSALKAMLKEERDTGREAAE